MSTPDKRPLVMLNGYAASGADWDPGFLGQLAETFELICLDNRGMGEFEADDPGAITIDSMARDALAALDQRQLEMTAVLGWSMGGFIAQRLTTLAPERVEALVLLGTDAGGPSATLARAGDWARMLDLSGTPRDRASRIISLLFAPDVAKQVDAAFGDELAASQSKMSPEVLGAQVSAMAGWHAERQPGGPTPVLVAHGNDDLVIPAVNADKLAQKWPAARVERFPAAGHAFMAQSPEAVAAVIRSFLTRD